MWFDFPATLQYHTTPWNIQSDHFTIKPKAHFYTFDVKICGIKLPQEGRMFMLHDFYIKWAYLPCGERQGSL